MLQKQCFSFLRVCNVCLCKIIIYISKGKTPFPNPGIKKNNNSICDSISKNRIFSKFPFQEYFFLFVVIIYFCYRCWLSWLFDNDDEDVCGHSNTVFHAHYRMSLCDYHNGCARIYSVSMFCTDVKSLYIYICMFV